MAELPLASGRDRAWPSGCPERLTDERTEVGQVGSALNTLLDHVEASLGARHRSEQQVRQFVADASHELRTPLATIAGYTELAPAPARDEPAPRWPRSRPSPARMTALVEDLLLLARLDAGRPLEREPVDLTRLLLEAVADARVLAPDHHWRLDLPDEPVVGRPATRRGCTRCVTNLLANARKHTPAGHARSRSTGTAVPARLHRARRRAGLPARPGRRAPSSASPAATPPAPGAGGAGLGLSLVEAIVAAHGGAVDADSRPGDTTITVRLPSRRRKRELQLLP